MKSLYMLALLALSGCATCQQHPVACGAATAFVAGSVALSMSHSGHGTASAQSAVATRPLVSWQPLPPPTVSVGP